MFGGRNHHRVDLVLLLLEHHPKVFVFGEVGKLPVEANDSAIAVFFCFNVSRPLGIHITQGNHIDSACFEHLGHDKGPVPSRADNTDIDQVTRR